MSSSDNGDSAVMTPTSTAVAAALTPTTGSGATSAVGRRRLLPLVLRAAVVEGDHVTAVVLRRAGVWSAGSRCVRLVRGGIGK